MSQDPLQTSVRIIRVTPDGSRAVSVSADGSLQLWDVKGASEIHRMTGHNAAVTEAAFVPNGSAVVSASRDRSIRIWDVSSGKEIASFFADSAVATCTVVSDPPVVIAGDDLGRTYFLRVEGLPGAVDAKGLRASRKREPLRASGPKLRPRFDVFLCHNSVDKPAVRLLNEKLKSRNIRPWLDEEQILPGTNWLDVLQKQIFQIRSAAVFIGRDGVGPWQQIEVDGLLLKFAKTGSPVIPVILDYCEGEPDVPLFLERLHRVDFRLTSPDPFENLVRGIKAARALGG